MKLTQILGLGAGLAASLSQLVCADPVVPHPVARVAPPHFTGARPIIPHFNRGLPAHLPPATQSNSGIARPSLAVTQFQAAQVNRARFLANQSVLSSAGRTQSYLTHHPAAPRSIRVLATHSGDWHRGWDRNHDHFWNGHRCRWQNGRWFVYAELPYYYPYAADYGGEYYGAPYNEGPFSSYDPYFYYGSTYTPNYEVEDNSTSTETNDAKVDDSAMIARVQFQLRKAGYYHDSVDGVVGPATRKALRRYQADQGLPASGEIDQSVLDAFGLK